MEKYRKFDDPRHGINPFNPLPEARRPILYLVPRYVRLFSLTSLVVWRASILREDARACIRALLRVGRLLCQKPTCAPSPHPPPRKVPQLHVLPHIDHLVRSEQKYSSLPRTTQGFQLLGVFTGP